MAYFDSSKNRALWEIELAGLKKERAAREAGRRTGTAEQAPQKRTLGREPVRMTYQDLLREEAEASRKAPRREGPARAAARERQKEMPAYEKR